MLFHHSDMQTVILLQVVIVSVARKLFHKYYKMELVEKQFENLHHMSPSQNKCVFFYVKLPLNAGHAL